MKWLVYILLCDQKTYYVGITNNLDDRIKTHRMKKNIGTKEFSDIRLVYKEVQVNKLSAAKREKQLKGWTKAKKQALIDGNLELLKKLSLPRA
ncbi:hypothetical protein A3B57_03875 [Microgenomates group bacterium RIFCSPLOWO2_01_FULL_47_10]|nr:MAG: hypothetical protein A3B57_03875 [Microgenomates group bacterium RIFCSPLOWO2_01_FULL_47_10]